VQTIHSIVKWYDDGIQGLTNLKHLTAAFPEGGEVSAKTLEIRDLNLVTCTGVSADNQALLRMLENLHKDTSVWT